MTWAVILQTSSPSHSSTETRRHPRGKSPSNAFPSDSTQNSKKSIGQLGNNAHSGRIEKRLPISLSNTVKKPNCQPFSQELGRTECPDAAASCLYIRKILINDDDENEEPLPQLYSEEGVIEEIQDELMNPLGDEGFPLECLTEDKAEGDKKSVEQQLETEDILPQLYRETKDGVEKQDGKEEVEGKRDGILEVEAPKEASVLVPEETKQNNLEAEADTASSSGEYETTKKTQSVEQVEGENFLRDTSKETGETMTEEEEEEEDERKVNLAVVQKETTANDDGSQTDTSASSAEEEAKGDRKSAEQQVETNDILPQLYRETKDGVEKQDGKEEVEGKRDGILEEDTKLKDEAPKEASVLVPEETKPNNLVAEADTASSSDEHKTVEKTKSLEEVESESFLTDVSKETGDAVTEEEEDEEDKREAHEIFEHIEKRKEKVTKGKEKGNLAVFHEKTTATDDGTKTETSASSAEDKAKGDKNSVEQQLETEDFLPELGREVKDGVEKQDKKEEVEGKRDGIWREDTKLKDEAPKVATVLMPNETEQNSLGAEVDTASSSDEHKTIEKTKSLEEVESESFLTDVSKETGDAVTEEEEDEEDKREAHEIFEHIEKRKEKVTKGKEKGNLAVFHEKTTATDDGTKTETSASSDSSQSPPLTKNKVPIFVPRPAEQDSGNLSKNGNHRTHNQSSITKNEHRKTQRKMQSWEHLFIFLVRFVLPVTNIPTVSGVTYCDRFQTAEAGKFGKIGCNFPDNFHAVYWFTEEETGRQPVASYFTYSNEKLGPGVEDMTYDISEDGPLLIPHVTVEHERNYTVIVYTNPDTFEINTVSLKVVAHPGNSSLELECNNCQHSYYRHFSRNGILECSLNVSRPPVQLQLIERSPYGDSLVQKQDFRIEENKDGTYKASVILSLTENENKLLTLLVCRASWDSGKWRREEETLLDFSHTESLSSLESNTLFLEVNRRAEVYCGDSGQTSKIWKKVISHRGSEAIGYKSGNVTELTKKLPNTEISDDGSLVFLVTQIDHEGVYACLFNGVEQDKIEMTNVTVLVPPSPPYIQIVGCEADGHAPCKFEEEDTDLVSCAVYGVRPNASLQWIARNPNHVSFFNSEHMTTKRGETFDVSVSTNFRVSEGVLCEEDVLIECHIYGPVANIIKADVPALIIPKSCKTKNGMWTSGQIIGGRFLLVVLLLVICMTTIIVVGCIYSRCKGPPEKHEPTVEQSLTDICYLD